MNVPESKADFPKLDLEDLTPNSSLGAKHVSLFFLDCSNHYFE